MSTTPCPNHSATNLSSSRLIIDQPDFLRVAPQLLVDVHRMAVGRVRQRTTGPVQENILDRWELQNNIPSGRERPPMLDWALMATAQPLNSTLQSIIERVQPKRSQLLIVVLLDPNDHSRLTTAIWHEGKWAYPEEIRLIGPKMLMLDDGYDTAREEPDQNSSFNSDSDWEAPNKSNTSERAMSHADLRASRTVGALRALYRPVKKSHVIVAGAGGGGQELITQLIACGVRHVTNLDADTVGLENLDRMPLALPSDVGEPKVVQMARAFHRQQPDLLIHAVPRAIHHPDSVKMLHGTRADAIFSFLDSDVGRLATSLLAREMHAIHIDVGTLIEYVGEPGKERRVMAADVRLFAPGQGCTACVPQMGSLETVLYHLSSPPNCLERGQYRSWDALRAGSLLHLNSTAAALAVETWLAWLEGNITTSTWTRLRWDGPIPRVESAAVGPTKECRFCTEIR